MGVVHVYVCMSVHALFKIDANRSVFDAKKEYK